MRGYALLCHNRFFLIKSQKKKEVPNSNREKKKNKRSQMRLQGNYRCPKLVLDRFAGHLKAIGNFQGRKIFSIIKLKYLAALAGKGTNERSEEHTSELQSLMRISYAVFCLKKKKQHYNIQSITPKSTTIRH